MKPPTTYPDCTCKQKTQRAFPAAEFAKRLTSGQWCGSWLGRLYLNDNARARGNHIVQECECEDVTFAESARVSDTITEEVARLGRGEKLKIENRRWRTGARGTKVSPKAKYSRALITHRCVNEEGHPRYNLRRAVTSSWSPASSREFMENEVKGRLASLWITAAFTDRLRGTSSREHPFSVRVSRYRDRHLTAALKSPQCKRYITKVVPQISKLRHCGLFTSVWCFSTKKNSSEFFSLLFIVV